MEGGSTAEWRIENFTCWHKDLHGELIATPDNFLPFYSKIKLYPRGLSGQDGHLIVRAYTGILSCCSCDLSLIASNGSLICTQEIKPKKDGAPIEIRFTHRFEEVVSQIKKNESEHGDRLTLQLKFKNVVHSTRHLYTIIDVLNISMKIDPDILTCNELISNISYSYGGVEEELFLKTGSVLKDGKTEIQLNPNIFSDRVFLVQSCVSLLRTDNTVVGYEEKEHVFRDKKPWIFSDSLMRRELSEKGITLLLRFKIIYGGPNKTYKCISFFPKQAVMVPNYSVALSDGQTQKSPSAIPFNHSVNELSKELMGLYQDQNFSDFQLRSGNVSFATHKGILSARSPVLKSMLSSDMREATSGCMDVADLDVPTLARFLAFLYSGTAEDMQWENALHLYYAADKYQVPTLKRECADFLTAHVSISNVCDVLSLADKHQDEELKKVSHDFMLNHFKEVLKSKEWRSFMGSEPFLALETVTYFAEKGYVGKMNT